MDAPERKTLEFLELLPKVECLSPKDSMESSLNGNCHKIPIIYVANIFPFTSTDYSKVAMDCSMFKNHKCQRVYQYLTRHTSQQDLNKFTYVEGVEEGTPKQCIELLLKYE